VQTPRAHVAHQSGSAPSGGVCVTSRDVTQNVTCENAPSAPSRRQYAARTVYLSERHLRDIERIIDAWQQSGATRLNRSAVLRRAVEHLRHTIEIDTEPAKPLLEND